MQSVCTSRIGKRATTNLLSRNHSAYRRLKSPFDAEAPTGYGARDYRSAGEEGIPTCAAERKPQNLQERSREACNRSFHAQKVLHPKLLKSILRDAEIGPDEFETLL
jgi:hypothetical protein